MVGRGGLERQLVVRFGGLVENVHLALPALSLSLGQPICSINLFNLFNRFTQAK